MDGLPDDSVHCFRQRRHAKAQDGSGAIARLDLQRRVSPVIGSLVDARHALNDVGEMSGG